MEPPPGPHANPRPAACGLPVKLSRLRPAFTLVQASPSPLHPSANVTNAAAGTAPGAERANPYLDVFRGPGGRGAAGGRRLPGRPRTVSIATSLTSITTATSFGSPSAADGAAPALPPPPRSGSVVSPSELRSSAGPEDIASAAGPVTASAESPRRGSAAWSTSYVSFSTIATECTPLMGPRGATTGPFPPSLSPEAHPLSDTVQHLDADARCGPLPLALDPDDTRELSTMDMANFSLGASLSPPGAGAALGGQRDAAAPHEGNAPPSPAAPNAYCNSISELLDGSAAAASIASRSLSSSALPLAIAKARRGRCAPKNNSHRGDAPPPNTTTVPPARTATAAAGGAVGGGGPQSPAHSAVSYCSAFGHSHVSENPSLREMSLAAASTLQRPPGRGDDHPLLLHAGERPTLSCAEVPTASSATRLATTTATATAASAGASSPLFRIAAVPSPRGGAAHAHSNNNNNNDCGSRRAAGRASFLVSVTSGPFVQLAEDDTYGSAVGESIATEAGAEAAMSSTAGILAEGVLHKSLSSAPRWRRWGEDSVPCELVPEELNGSVSCHSYSYNHHRRHSRLGRAAAVHLPPVAPSPCDDVSSRSSRRTISFPRVVRPAGGGGGGVSCPLPLPPASPSTASVSPTGPVAAFPIILDVTNAPFDGSTTDAGKGRRGEQLCPPLPRSGGAGAILGDDDDDAQAEETGGVTQSPPLYPLDDCNSNGLSAVAILSSGAATAVAPRYPSQHRAASAAPMGLDFASSVSEIGSEISTVNVKRSCDASRMEYIHQASATGASFFDAIASCTSRYGHGEY